MAPTTTPCGCKSNMAAIAAFEEPRLGSVTALRTFTGMDTPYYITIPMTRSAANLTRKPPATRKQAFYNGSAGSVPNCFFHNQVFSMVLRGLSPPILVI